MKNTKKLLPSVVASALMAGSAQAAISGDTVKLGYLADMSGTYRDLAGPNGLTAMEMAVADFGGKVNNARIEVVSADDRNSPDVASSTVRRWVENDGVDMVGGLVASSVTIATTKILEENNKLAMISGSAASSITNEHCTPNHIQYVYDTYALSIGTPTAIVQEGGKSWYILTADYAFGHAMEADVTRVVEANGGEILGSIRHPFPTPDFSSFILQAQASGADVIYWDMNDETRAWSDRFMEETGTRPTMVHAGIYSSTMQYLKAVEATGSDDPQTVRQHLIETPINDMFAKNGRIREDGRMVHDMFLAQVKTPEESTGEWDLYKIVRTIPGDEAFRPLSESKCKLITN